MHLYLMLYLNTHNLLYNSTCLLVFISAVCKIKDHYYYLALYDFNVQISLFHFILLYFMLFFYFT